MLPSPESTRRRGTPEATAAEQAQPRPCPLCRGPLQLIRGTQLCRQCGFTICESCEGGSAWELGEDAVL